MAQAYEDNVSPYTGFNRIYEYDQYGNRRVTTSTGLYYIDSREPTSGHINASNNRLNMTGISYDLSGNQTSFGGYNNISYDAEGRISAMNSASEGNEYYLYDGDGNRVKKVWVPHSGPTKTSYYFYNALGQLAVEYSSDLVASASVPYPFTDMLGSTRAVTNQSGAVTECYDYLPFGRMLSSSDNGRGGCHPPAPDISVSSSMPQKFTGKERDETGLDYFVNTYLSTALGRWTSPDPSLVRGDSGFLDSIPKELSVQSYMLSVLSAELHHSD